LWCNAEPQQPLCELSALSETRQSFIAIAVFSAKQQQQQQYLSSPFTVRVLRNAEDVVST